MRKKLNIIIGILFMTLAVQSALAQVEITDSIMLKPTIGVGKTPVAVDVDTIRNKIYVVNQNSNNVSVIDGNADTLVASIAVGDTPVDICVNSVTDKIYVVNKGSNNISVIDGSTGKVVDTITVDTMAFYYENGHIGVNTATNKIYLSNGQKGKISVIDGFTNTVVDTIVIGNYTRGLCINSLTNKVYVAGNGKISIIDGISDTVMDTIPISVSDICLNPITNKIYAIDSYSLFVVNENADTLIKTICVFEYIEAICVNPSTNKVYIVSNGYQKNIAVIDGASDSLIKTVETGLGPSDICVNPVTDKIYTVNGDILVLSGASDEIIATVRYNECPSGICVNPSTNKIYVGNSVSNDVKVIDGTNNTIISTTDVGYYFSDICVDSSTNKIYAALSGFLGGSPKNKNGAGSSANISVIDGVSDTVINRIYTGYIGGLPFSICVNPTTNRIYVGTIIGFFGGTRIIHIPVIDGGKDSIIDTININKYGGFMNFGGIGAICGNETTNKIYVCEMYVGNNNILVIDGATNEIVDTLVASGSICVNTITNKIYAGGTNISIINGINDSIIAVVPTGNYITGICVNPTINRIYAVSQYDSTLSVIDGIGDSLIQKISLGRKPTRIAVNPQTNIIYVSCSDAGEVLVLKDNTGVEEKSSPPGRDVATLQISKNPFIKSTVISYSIPATSKVSLALYDVSGRCAKTLVNGEKEAGRYTINLNAKDLKTGVYFVRLTAGHYKEIKKLILMR